LKQRYKTEKNAPDLEVVVVESQTVKNETKNVFACAYARVCASIRDQNQVKQELLIDY
jgi:hypothetical protein